MKRPNINHKSGELRPKWRGRVHALAATASIPAGTQLAVLARGAAAVWSSVVFAASMLLVFSISASYHLLARTRRSQAFMQRLDHAAIYLLIAGTYTPLCVVGLPPRIGYPLLVVIWSGALLGVVLKATARADGLARALYMVLGWSAGLALPFAWGSINKVTLALIALGGVIYTAGAIGFATNKPKLKPLVFGYHEVWHSATVIAGALHFAAVAQIVR